MDFLPHLQVIWDYLCLHQPPQKADVIVGDFQRMDLYAKKGYQLPQEIPEAAWEAFHSLVAMGYDKQLAK